MSEGRNPSIRSQTRDLIAEVEQVTNVMRLLTDPARLDHLPKGDLNHLDELLASLHSRVSSAQRVVSVLQAKRAAQSVSGRLSPRGGEVRL